MEGARFLCKRRIFYEDCMELDSGGACHYRRRAGWFFGEMDGFFYALIAFVVIDYLTGVMCAIIDKTLSSNVGFKGIFRKVLIFVMVASAM